MVTISVFFICSFCFVVIGLYLMLLVLFVAVVSSDGFAVLLVHLLVY